MTHRSQFRFILEGFEGIGVLLSVMLSWPISRVWLRQWGSRAEEREQTWPGDKLVSVAHTSNTRAIDINAPADVVWKWVVQFGLNRAGFYSYELLERIVGIPVKNVESIVPRFQSLSVGDEIRLHPKAPGVPVALLEPGRFVCFGKLNGQNPPTDQPNPLRSWSIYIEPISHDSCRLLVRACIERLHEPSWSKRFGLMIEDAIDFVMEQRMLRTIRRLAESTFLEKEVSQAHS